jgi:hypothetical protein
MIKNIATDALIRLSDEQEQSAHQSLYLYRVQQSI